MSRADWYELRDGLRHVVPYVHTFTSFAKRRWVGQCVLDVLGFEFPDRCTPDALARDAAAGRLRLNGARVTSDAVFRDGDKLDHDVVREEPPVPAAPIELLPTGRPDLIAIAKPAGMSAG